MPSVLSDLSFEALHLSPETLKAVYDMGFTRPTQVQAAAFTPVLEGHDILVQSHTGSGKTVAYGMPLAEMLNPLDRQVQALILLPTRELANQVAEELSKLFAHRTLSVAAVYGGAGMGGQIAELKSGVQVVAGTPGRLLDHLRRKTLSLSGLRILILDEADEMLSMGFAKDLDAILEFLPKERQSLLFSATIPEDIRSLAQRFLHNPEMVSLSNKVGPKEVTHYCYMVSGMAKQRDLVRLIKTTEPEDAIIFCNTREDTHFIATYLRRQGFDAEEISGDLPQSEREVVMGKIKRKELRFLVATDVAARGIDISELSHVINYSIPEYHEVYIHRTGRTGRAGRSGTAISLVAPQELGNFVMIRKIYKLETIERELPQDIAFATESTAKQLAVKKPETKPEPKPNPRPTEPKPKQETKPEAKTEAKPETKLDVKAEAKPEIKAEAQNEEKTAKPETKVERRPEPTETPEPQAEVKAEAKPETKPEPKPEPKVENKPEPKADVKPEPKAEARQETKPEPRQRNEARAETRQEPKQDTRAEARAESRNEPRAEAKAETKQEPKAEARSQERKPTPLPTLSNETWGEALDILLSPREIRSKVEVKQEPKTPQKREAEANRERRHEQRTEPKRPAQVNLELPEPTEPKNVVVDNTLPTIEVAALSPDELAGLPDQEDATQPITGDIATAFAEALRETIQVQDEQATQANPDDNDDEEGEGEEVENQDNGKMTRLYLNLGRRDHVRASEVTRFLREHVKLTRRDLGRVQVRDTFSHVGIRLDLAEQLVKALKGQKFRNKEVVVELAKHNPNRNQKGAPNQEEKTPETKVDGLATAQETADGITESANEMNFGLVGIGPDIPEITLEAKDNTPEEVKAEEAKDSTPPEAPTPSPEETPQN